jgi:hypothetical protein
VCFVPGRTMGGKTQRLPFAPRFDDAFAAVHPRAEWVKFIVNVAVRKTSVRAKSLGTSLAAAA